MNEPISYWHDSLEPDDLRAPRPSLPGDRQTSVAIIGAGFAGLWTAYYLLKDAPSRDVIVIDAKTAGFGASGRNGGWCVPEIGADFAVIDREGGAGTAARMMRAMHRSVDEVGAVAAREEIDCGYQKGGALWFASDAAQLERLQARVKLYEQHGLGDAYQLLDPSRTVSRINATGLYGSIFTPEAAAVHPARLARGLARAVERLGGSIYEMTPALRIEDRAVVTPHGVIKADVIVRATEAYTAHIKGYDRRIVPVQSFVIATEPIADELWAEIGLSNRELFEDTPLLLAYGQRTADGRIIWGGCGARYVFGSKPPLSRLSAPAQAERLRARLVERFPMLRDVKVTHHWGGVLGLTRDMRSTIGFDKATGEAWIGGFGGAGVAPSNAAGRGLADLIAGAETELSRFPWANHRSPRWEPEPVRWIGVNARVASFRFSDKIRQLRS